MLILQNQCNVRLPKFKESSTNIEFDHWKCIRIYQKAHMISEKKYISLAGAQTHEIDYFRTWQNLEKKPAFYSKLFFKCLDEKMTKQLTKLQAFEVQGSSAQPKNIT